MEFARACGLSRSTVHRMIRRGRIQSRKIGGRRLIGVTELRFREPVDIDATQPPA